MTVKCLFFVAAIEACKRELSGTTTDYMHGQSECSEQTSSEGPVLEEFIPIKRTPSCSDNDEGNEDEDEEDELERQKSQSKRNRSSSSNKDNHNSSNGDLKKKSDWLRSVQLWSQSPDPSPKEVYIFAFNFSVQYFFFCINLWFVNCCRMGRERRW